uniref:ORF60 n=1 Tax=Malaco herpesvirus 2 TaxID=3031798 RepID=A0AA48SEZ6_9VIRU|nr:TPA_asm: ORF60 [Malaco herpesvirus 2]
MYFFSKRSKKHVIRKHFYSHNKNVSLFFSKKFILDIPQTVFMITRLFHVQLRQNKILILYRHGKYIGFAPNRIPTEYFTVICDKITSEIITTFPVNLGNYHFLSRVCLKLLVM